MSVDPRRGRPYVYAGPSLANDQGVTGQETDTPPPPPPEYDNADGYTGISYMPRDIPLPIEEYPYDDVPRPYDRGPKIPSTSAIADIDDPVAMNIARWQAAVYARGNVIRSTSEGIFETNPEGTRILSMMPTGTDYI